MSYHDEAARFQATLSEKATEDDQIAAWVAFLSEQGYSEEEVYDVVLTAAPKRLTKAEAEHFAAKVRRKFAWRPNRRW